MRHSQPLAFVGLLLVLLLAACGGDDEGDAATTTTTAASAGVEDAEGAYCESLQALFNSAFAAQELTSASAIEEAQDAVDAVHSAYADVVAAAGNYTGAQISDIESAREVFETAVSGIPDSGTLGDGQPALQNALEGYFEAVGPAVDTQCPAAG